jgi:rare lipoprotein A
MPHSQPARSDPGSIPTGLLLRKPGGFYTDDAPDVAPPVDLDALAEPVPRDEPLNAGANQPYTVFGRQYVPLAAPSPYHRQGTVSWYGRKFHGQRTTSGEVYDMFALSAAHPTLPIPSYAKVTNLANRRSVIVRINDRGPFGAGRIMDVSYAVAHKLGFVEDALAHVEVEAIVPAVAPVVAAPEPPPAPAVASKPRPEPAARLPLASRAGRVFLQLGAFANAVNAENFSARLKRQLDWVKEPLHVTGRNGLYRIQLGPFKDRAQAGAVAARIREAVELKPVVVTN